MPFLPQGKFCLQNNNCSLGTHQDSISLLTFREPEDKPSAQRLQRRLDLLALRTAIYPQRLDEGLAMTWIEKTEDNAIANGALRRFCEKRQRLTQAQDKGK